MYIKSPMENYNKNNPFIIIAKKVYDNLIDLIHGFSKKCIISSILLFVTWCIYTISEIYDIYINDKYIDGISFIILTLLINVSLIIIYKSKISYFISKSPAIQEFGRLSKLEVSDILTLNNEDLLKCVYGLYELRGELTSTIKYYKIYFIIYGILEILLTIFNFI